MKALILLAPIVGGAALFAIALWLERATRKPGLSFLIGGVVLVCGAGLSFTQGYRFLPLLFLLQAIGFLYHAHWRRATTPSKRAGPAEPNIAEP